MFNVVLFFLLSVQVSVANAGSVAMGKRLPSRICVFGFNTRETRYWFSNESRDDLMFSVRLAAFSTPCIR